MEHFIEKCYGFPLFFWSAPDMTPSRFFYSGIFLVGVCLMALQIMHLRLLSVTTWPHLALLVTGAALSGVTLAALMIHKGDAEAQRNNHAALAAKAADDLGLFIIVALMALMLVPVLHTSFLGTILTVPVMAFLTALPCYKAGKVLTLALTRTPHPVTRTYGIAMIGAAAGCLFALFLMQILDAPSAVLVLSMTAFASALFFMRTAPQDGNRPKISAKSMIVLVGAALAFNVLAHKPFIYPHWIKSEMAPLNALALNEWNAISRVTARHEIKGGIPFLRGPSPLLPEDARSSYYMLAIDGDAGMPIDRFEGIRENLDFLNYDITSLAYALPGIKKAAIIGIGGGRDVLAAHYFGAQDITALDISTLPITLLSEQEPFKTYAGLSGLPGLRLIQGAARSWFSRNHAEKFDLIQIGLTDTWAATGAGALALSENGLYTAEGWSVFLGSLSDDGSFTVSRWHDPPTPEELDRLISLAARALLDAGEQNLPRHVFLAAAGRVATLILSKSPLTPEQIAALESQTKRRGFEILVAPGHTSTHAMFDTILSAKNTAELESGAVDKAFNIAPPTDNRPFFFSQVRMSNPLHMLRLVFADGGQAFPGSAKAALSLCLLLCFSLFTAAFAVLGPLRGARAAGMGKGYIATGTAWFALSGMGFMLLETALLQRMNIFLGHPAYGLGAALPALFLSAGLGSFLSERFPLTSGRIRAVWIAATALLALALAIGPGLAFQAFADWPLAGRMGLCAALFLPPGLLLGFGFPTGMTLVQRIDERPSAWFWGIGSAAGLTGSALAAAFGIALGLNWTIILGGLCYGLLILPSAGFSRYGKHT